MTRSMSRRRIPKPLLEVLATIGLVALVASCGGPLLMIPGGALSGEVIEAPVDDWSFADDTFIDVELRPEDPYSVELNYIVRDGQLYLDPAEGRRWFEYLKDDPRLRVRFGSRIYPVTAVLVGQPGELDGFDTDRYVYRLDSRAIGD